MHLLYHNNSQSNFFILKLMFLFWCALQETVIVLVSRRWRLWQGGTELAGEDLNIHVHKVILYIPSTPLGAYFPLYKPRGLTFTDQRLQLHPKELGWVNNLFLTALQLMQKANKLVYLPQYSASSLWHIYPGLHECVHDTVPEHGAVHGKGSPRCTLKQRRAAGLLLDNQRMRHS